MSQFDRFGAAPVDEGNLVGLKVKLDRPVDRERPCCRNVCIISAGKGPHAGELHCADCGQHRGWVSKSTAAWIEHVMTRFGAPTTPIIVRKSEEMPPAKRTHVEHEHEHQLRNKRTSSCAQMKLSPLNISKPPT